MFHRHLKLYRLIISLFFLFSITVLFIDFRGVIPVWFSDAVLFLQFVPSVLKFIHILGYAASGFLIIIILNVLFGRIYCSTVCPLGILQDIISYLAKKIRRKKRYKYARAHTFLRYLFLALPFIPLIFGSIFLINLLDPYSNFGRISSDLFRPLVIGINNLISLLFQKVNLYLIPPVDYKHFNLVTVLFPAAFLGFIIWISFYHGRLFCNTVCPVGTLLGLLSRLSVFKIKINSITCTRCGKCIAVCKANCIDIKKFDVDFSRCIACYNCIKPCPEDAIKYKFHFAKEAAAIKDITDAGKREFIAKSVFYALGLTGLAKVAGAQQTANAGKKLIPVVKENPVSPPGSGSIRHFNNNCTACHLCVTACPTAVLQPSFLEYGFTGMMQPHMDYKTNYCNYNCTICGEVCPTGAILPLTREDKKLTQIGRVHFIMKNCIVYTDRTACGSCAEHCPTQAVTMVPYIEDLTIPFIM
jgi:ferredoxin